MSELGEYVKAKDYDELEAKLAELKRDKERMDCLQQHFEDFYWQGDFPSPEKNLRKAIDKWRTTK